jgi:gluconate 2-dehydrogenase gamma chain
MLDRRQALHRISLLLGVAICESTIATVVAGCRAAQHSGYTPKALNAGQYERLACLVELIIPTTDTPGARDAGVHTFIDGMLAEVYTEQQRRDFLLGLEDVEARAQAAGASFVASTLATQTQILQQLEAGSAPGPERRPGEPRHEPLPFFAALKELTLLGYYTSEVGATQELKYVHAAGSYDGDVPFARIGRAYS